MAVDLRNSKIYYLITLACLIFAGDLLSQQSTNPFDIIKTSSVDQNKISYIPENDNTIIPVQQIDSLDNSSILDTLKTDSISPNDSLDLSTTAPNTIQDNIDQNNPFNVLQTAGNTNNTPINLKQDKSKVSPQPQKAASSKVQGNSWMPSFVPRKADFKSSSSFSLNFIFWIIITSLLVLAAVINLKRKSFLNLYRAITNDNYLKLLQREENNGFTFFFLLLYIIFLLNSALYIYLLLINKFEVGGYKLYLFTILGIAGIYLVRYISIYVLQVCFPVKKEARQYNFTITMFNIIVGLLLIPINILTAYASFGPTLLYAGLGVIGIFYLLRQLRGLFIAARTKGLSYFHFFIYLCTFEVAPIFWLLSFLNY